MNLSPMMYRLNHAQGQKLPVANEQMQQQPQQQQQQQQIIPSHIVLQQQLDAATLAAAAANTTSSTTGVVNTSEQVFLNNLTTTIAGTELENDNAIPLTARQHGNTVTVNTTTTNNNTSLLHIQTQPSTTRHASNKNSNKTGIVITATTANKSGHTVLIQPSSSISSPTTASVVVDVLRSTSVEENLKLLKTAIKSEPLQHDSSSSSNSTTISISNTTSAHSNNNNNSHHHLHHSLGNTLNSNSQLHKDDIINLATGNNALANVIIPATSSNTASALPTAASSSSAVKVNKSALTNAINQVVALSGSSSSNTSGNTVVITAGASDNPGVSVNSGSSGGGETNGSSLVFMPSKRARIEL